MRVAAEGRPLHDFMRACWSSSFFGFPTLLMACMENACACRHNPFCMLSLISMALTPCLVLVMGQVSQQELLGIGRMVIKFPGNSEGF